MNVAFRDVQPYPNYDYSGKTEQSPGAFLENKQATRPHEIWNDMCVPLDNALKLPRRTDRGPDGYGLESAQAQTRKRAVHGDKAT